VDRDCFRYCTVTGEGWRHQCHAKGVITNGGRRTSRRHSSSAGGSSRDGDKHREHVRSWGSSKHRQNHIGFCRQRCSWLPARHGCSRRCRSQPHVCGRVLLKQRPGPDVAAHHLYGPVGGDRANPRSGRGPMRLSFLSRLAFVVLRCRYCGCPLDTADLVCVRMCDRCCRTGKDVAAARRRG